MVFLVHRHGDRSSEKVQLFLSDNPEELARMSEPYGFGQLTDSGKARSYALGQYLRHRYNALLSSSYDPSEIFVSSTESDRTQMTARIAVTGAYSTEVLWSEDMEVVPVEIDMVPAKVDPNLSFMNCPKLTSYFLGFQAENRNVEKQNYEEVLDVLFEEMGLNLPKCPLLMYAMADYFASQESVGMPFTAMQQKLGPAVRQGAGQAINYMFGNPEYIPLQAGVLLNEFFDTADQIISGANIPRVRVLSGHDFNVYSFLAATRAVPKQGVPGYCAVYSLELRRCRSSGEYVVVPVYANSPNEGETYLEIEDCGTICEYERFRRLTSEYVMTEDQLREKCKSEGTVSIDALQTLFI
ncbi:hypothetical protein B5X24_HaOG213971 [Helicoverpa armigera]|nr:hypothetical protein B5X24_HaOG213971 [Helicoverpa armigera]